MWHSTGEGSAAGCRSRGRRLLPTADGQVIQGEEVRRASAL